MILNPFQSPTIKYINTYTYTGTAGTMTMLDPLSGRMIPVNEMSEHMRVALLDPKWRVEQQRFQEKQKGRYDFR